MNPRKRVKKLRRLSELEDLINKEKEKREKETRPIISISSGTCGRARGSEKLTEAFKKAIRQENLQDKIILKSTGCHGFCEAEPNVIIYPEGIFYQKLAPKNAQEIIQRTILKGEIIDSFLYVDPTNGQKAIREGEISFYRKQRRIVLGANPLIDPLDIYDYFSIGGYSSLLKTLSSLSPEEVIETIKKSGLRGRGGAGFPTGKKWEFARAQKSELKYIICNADEGDPGAYMDRSLLEGNPHRVIEGMIIGAYAIGASEGYIYVRDEYPLAVANVSIALEQARKLGLLGENILGTGFNFDLHIAKGAGAFVCGEETALIASIEGRVGEPRQRPPYPAVKGLWGKPTVINNVETWGNVPIILEKGADWFASIGTNGSKGTKIFSLVGKINNTGLVEVPMGITLREIIFDIGGGIPQSRKFKAVQTGGPSGGCLPEKLIDLPIDYESLTQAGSIMGSGGMIVMDDRTCMVDVARYFLNFLRDESCGKCLSCREGTQRLWEIVTEITKGKGTMDHLALLEELAMAVKDASLCGLGQTAPNPVLSTLRYFRDEYEAHIKYKKCPALVCKDIISSPCHYICPIDQEASTYIALIAQGRFEEAYNVILKDNPLPSVCSRVCHHPCESVCRAGEGGEPIAIRALKRFVIDWAREHNIQPNIPSTEKSRERVAIIGAGPAGLTAGYYLSLRGFQVTIFDSLPQPGGWLIKGIPKHRLPRELLQRDIDNIIKTGIEIRTNATLGRDFSLADLFNQGFKAIFLATGAHRSIKLGIPGEEAEGVIQATELLKKINFGEKVELRGKIAIIGGGNAAIDAARVAIRNENCQKVIILYRRTINEMPAFKEEIESALEEGVEIQFLTAPKRIIVKEGKVIGLECLRMKLGEPDSSGRRRPIPIEGSEFIVDVNMVIPAIGERPDISYLQNVDRIQVTKEETIVVDRESFMTNLPGVFAGGDVVTGPATVVEAMAAGKKAAKTIEEYVSTGKIKMEYKLKRPSIWVEQVKLSEDELEKARRPKLTKISMKLRKSSFKEVEQGLSENQAILEAKRCLRCDLETEEAKMAMRREK